jgi:CheY-like chemotaxis protein
MDGAEIESSASGGTEKADSVASPLIGELGWLMEAQPVKPERLSDEVQAALDVVQPLAAKNGVTLNSQVADGLPGLAVHSAALNQILVTLLGLAINEAGSGAVKVSARQLPVAVEIILKVTATSQPVEHGSEANAGLEIAEELAHISGGRLYRQSTSGSPFPIRLVLPALEQFPVLIIDDNEDSLQLFKRYAAGTRYDIVSTRDTDQVAALVERIHPRIIVLDIMMPKENGWIVLGRLRQHPLTAETPIIISTILPQEKLAISLGASAYLKKPVSRQSFLQALDQQFALLEPEFP